MSTAKHTNRRLTFRVTTARDTIGYYIRATDEDGTDTPLAVANRRENGELICRHANAHGINADLLAACKDLLHRLECQLMNVNSCDVSDEDEAGIEQAKSAIAQAEGEV